MGFWKSLKGSPAEPVHKQEVPKTIGFWCIPTGGQYIPRFTKLAIKQYYTLDDGTKKVTISANRVEAGWTIIAGCKLLAQFFPWVSELFEEILASYGPKIFNHLSDIALQQRALDCVSNAALQHGFAYVVSDPSDPSVALIRFATLPSYAKALYDDLAGLVYSDPPAVRLNKVMMLSVIGADDSRESPRPIRNVLLGTTAESGPSLF